MGIKQDIGVFSELSDPDEPHKRAIGHWNTRVFNKTDFHVGDCIQLEEGTGVITLTAGTYHITGSSMVTYSYIDNPEGTEENPGWPTKVVPNGSYSRLRYLEDEFCGNDECIVLGTICNANMLPSLIETYLIVEKSRKVIFEHQAGYDGDPKSAWVDPRELGPPQASVAEGIYLRDQGGPNSIWHIFARIAIRRVGEA